MNSAELLLNWYVELTRWETEVATPQDIVSVLEDYPTPWRQWALLFETWWHGVELDETKHGPPAATDDSLGFTISAFETPEAVLIFDDCRNHGYFRIPKKLAFACETRPRTAELAAV
jgi:hypothetical protein